MADTSPRLRDRPLMLYRQLVSAGTVPARSPHQCEHLLDFPVASPGDWSACLAHTAADGPTVHLRACLGCDFVGCCDSSPARHASAHARSSGHPVMQSAQPDESWRWCYPDELLG